MHKHILLSTILLLGTLSTTAQKEVYFNDTNIDRKDIKVNKTLQGLSLKTDFVYMIGDFLQHNIMLDLHYFHEDRIAPTLTLHSFAGLQNRIELNKYIYHSGYDEYGNYHSGRHASDANPLRAYYNLNLQLGTELRWYVGYRPRYVRNKKVANNTGWFLGIPVTFTAYLLQQPDGYIKQWLPKAFNAQLTFSAKVGYRHAFNEHWLLETSLAYTPAYFIMAPYGNYFYLSDGWLDMFRLELRAAYVF